MEEFGSKNSQDRLRVKGLGRTLQVLVRRIFVDPSCAYLVRSLWLEM